MITDNKILIYETDNGNFHVDVRLDKDTVWLTQKQMAELFDKDSDTVGLHIKNIYKEKELDKFLTTEKYSVVQKEGRREVKRKLYFYNLDVIISVGYRVKSIRGTQFRIWATKILREHIIKGYTVNQKRLEELKRSIKLINTVVDKYSTNTDETKALIKIVSDYTYALDLLDDYDYQRVKITSVSDMESVRISYVQVRGIIDKLTIKFSAGNLFGKEKDGSIHSCINTIYQSFGEYDLYPSIEEKASNLLYFLVKNHPFVDGNKRIAAFIFIWFLDLNNYLYKYDGSKRIADNTLVALTLMIAESKPEERETIIKIVINLINKNNG